MQPRARGDSFLTLTHEVVGMSLTEFRLVHHRGLVEESSVPLVFEKALVLAVQKYVPGGHEYNLGELSNDKPFQPGSLHAKHVFLIHAVLTRG